MPRACFIPRSYSNSWLDKNNWEKSNRLNRRRGTSGSLLKDLHKDKNHVKNGVSHQSPVSETPSYITYHKEGISDDSAKTKVSRRSSTSATRANNLNTLSQDNNRFSQSTSTSKTKKTKLKLWEKEHLKRDKRLLSSLTYKTEKFYQRKKKRDNNINADNSDLKGHARSGQFAAATPAAAMAKGRHLLKWHDMPPHLQFNPYIHTGYRPMLTFWQSLQSLTYLHNETINIITHGIPIVYILVVVPRSIPWEKIESHFLAWCHFAGSISPWIGSFLYHLFMNWNLSSKFYYRLLQLDMLGIWVTQSFGALPMVSASIHCLHPILQWFSMACYTAFSIFGLYKAMTACSPWNRRLCFTLPFLMRNLLCLLRLTRWGGGDPSAMSTVILQDLVSVIGGAIGAMNIPERWFPGSLDYYLNSHNIMHILVVLAVYFMHLSTMKDLVWMTHGSCPGEPVRVTAPDL